MNVPSGRRWAASACMLGLLLVTGCTPGGGVDPTPTPAPVTATPPETAQEREQRLAYEAAEKNYRAFRAEYGRLSSLGGTMTPTQVLRDTSGGTYQAELMDVLRAFKSQGFHTSGEEAIPQIQRTGFSATMLGLRACEDDRRVRTFDRNGKVVDRGDVLVVQLEVKNINGNWRVWSGTGVEEATCDGF